MFLFNELSHNYGVAVIICKRHLIYLLLLLTLLSFLSHFHAEYKWDLQYHTTFYLNFKHSEEIKRWKELLNPLSWQVHTLSLRHHFWGHKFIFNCQGLKSMRERLFLVKRFAGKLTFLSQKQLILWMQKPFF